jgi:hypothetical protein
MPKVSARPEGVGLAGRVLENQGCQTDLPFVGAWLRWWWKTGGMAIRCPKGMVRSEAAKGVAALSWHCFANASRI